MTNAQLKNSIWRVPLICLIAGLLYMRCYVWIVLRFGVLAPGEINDTVGLLTDAGLLAAFMALGWLIFLQRQTRREVFISSSVVVVYGILLWALQLLTGSGFLPQEYFPVIHIDTLGSLSVDEKQKLRIFRIVPFLNLRHDTHAQSPAVKLFRHLIYGLKPIMPVRPVPMHCLTVEILPFAAVRLRILRMEKTAHRTSWVV